MDFLKIVLLAVVQGVTEFLPISSSAHLFYVKKALGLSVSINYIDIFLHIGTLLPVVIFFRKDFLIFLSILGSFIKLINKFGFIYRFNNCSEFNFSASIVISTLSTALVAIFLKLNFSNLIFSENIVAYMLLISGTVLILTKLRNHKVRGLNKLRLMDSIFIGVVQGLSILPGISRLAMTLSYSIIIGLDYSFSLKYSFFLSVPAILGIFFFDLWSFNFKNLLFNLIFIFFGVVISSLVGYFSLKYFFYVGPNKIYLFGFYCYIFSLLVLVFF